MLQQAGLVRKNITFQTKKVWSVNKFHGKDVSDIPYNELQ